MLIENEFTVQAPADDVYRLMLDVERVAPCIPGAEVLGAREDGGFDAKVSMKMGPMSMGYKGSVAIAEQDDEARRAVMQAKGAEQRGQGNAQATMTMSVTELDDGGTQVKVSSDILVTGRVAQMGRGIMQDVATRMMGEMARCIEATVSASSNPAPAEAGATETTAAAASADASASAASAAATTPASTAQPVAPPPQAAPPPRPASSPAQAAPIRGGRLFVAVVWGRIRSLARRGR